MATSLSLEIKLTISVLNDVKVTTLSILFEEALNISPFLDD